MEVFFFLFLNNPAKVACRNLKEQWVGILYHLANPV
jgi:hypothetical protein